MIADHISSVAFYGGLPQGLVKALTFLSQTDLTSLPIGRTELQGDRLFALVQEYDPKPIEQGRWESHRKYHDVQMVVGGAERMGYAHIRNLTVAEPYDQGKDLIFYAPAAGDYFTLRSGDWAIFTPQDAHMPAIALPDAPSGQKVRKIVMKVLV